MKNNIKKITAAAMAIALLGTGSAVSQVVSPCTCTGIATNAIDISDLSPAVIKIEKDEIAKNKNGDKVTMPKGTIKATLHIDKNQGFSLSGLSIPFDSTKCTVKTKNGQYLYHVEDAGEGIIWSVSVNDNVSNKAKNQGYSGLVAFSSMGTELNNKSGDMISVYLEPKNGIDLSKEKMSDLFGTVNVDKFLDPKTEPVKHEEPKSIIVIGITPQKDEIKTEIKYMVGDVNGDRKINVADSQLICNMIKNPIDMTSKAGLCADVDGNGTVTIDDAFELLDYYSNVGVSYNSYSHNRIGKMKSFYILKK